MNSPLPGAGYILSSPTEWPPTKDAAGSQVVESWSRHLTSHSNMPVLLFNRCPKMSSTIQESLSTQCCQDVQRNGKTGKQISPWMTEHMVGFRNTSCRPGL